jgi:hypothetical protein
MSEERTLERALRDKIEGKSPATQAGQFVREENEHIRHAVHGNAQSHASKKRALEDASSAKEMAESKCLRQPSHGGVGVMGGRGLVGRRLSAHK